MFENESEEEAPLILTDEVKNGKSTIINKHLSPAVRKIVNEQNMVCIMIQVVKCWRHSIPPPMHLPFGKT